MSGVSLPEPQLEDDRSVVCEPSQAPDEVVLIEVVRSTPGGKVGDGSSFLAICYCA